MCGVGGFAGLDCAPPEQIRQRLEAMNATMVHRGPDDGRIRLLPSLHGGLAARRLSLLDLSMGTQPVFNEDGSVAAVLNGEIYNHGELRNRLRRAGHRFRSHCDTEVLVHLYEEMGDSLLPELNGMFGLAIADLGRRRLLIARDRAGMKPLYYALAGGRFVFASEIKAIFASGLMTAEPDWDAIDTALAAQYLPAPYTGFEGVRKVGAGEWVVFDGTVARGRFQDFRYQPAPYASAENAAASELEHRLSAAVKSHLAADVPVGLYLSGGADSNLVAALAARHADARLHSFSIVFPEDPSIDESRYSRLMARTIGSRHHEVEYRAALLPDLLPAVVDHLEEPVTTAPAALEYMLSRLAGSHVKAVLSGEGADELFGGYWWYQRDRYYQWRRRIPAGLRRLMAPFLRAAAGRTPQIRWSRLLGFVAAGSDTAADVEWQRLFTAAERAALLRRRHRGPDLQPLHLEGSFGGHVDRLLATDILRRLPDGILLINDKQSMAHSLEVRMPFLDRAVIDFAAGLPGHYKVRNGREKYILTRLGHLLPVELAARRKHGLRYPKGTLFTGPLAAMARERFTDGSLLRPESALPLLKLAESGNADAVRKTWTLLFLQLWWDRFLGSRAREEFQERYAVPAATGGRQ